MAATATQKKAEASMACGLDPELNGKLLLQVGPTNSIYLVDHGWRRFVEDYTLKQLFKPEANIEEFPVDQILLGTPVARNACLVNSSNEPGSPIYLIDHNPDGGWELFKRHIVNPGVYNLYQFTNKVFTVPEIVLQAIPTGDPIVGPPLTVVKR